MATFAYGISKKKSESEGSPQKNEVANVVDKGSRQIRFVTLGKELALKVGFEESIKVVFLKYYI